MSTWNKMFAKATKDFDFPGNKPTLNKTNQLRYKIRKGVLNSKLSIRHNLSNIRPSSIKSGQVTYSIICTFYCCSDHTSFNEVACEMRNKMAA